MNALLAIWLVVGGFGGWFIQLMLSSIDENGMFFRNAFFFAECFYYEHKDKLNAFGLWLCIIVISVAVFPGSMLSLTAIGIMKLLQLLWKVFLFIFKKRR